MRPPAAAIRRARNEDVEALAELFDAYRQFYGRPSDFDGARAFLSQRMQAADSVIFIAEHDGKMIGFTQLYPSFSSVSMARTFVLNDLFVASEHRRTNAGEALLDAATRFARQANVHRLTLSTQKENRTAQALYEKNGWVRDEQFHVYNLRLAD